MFGWKAFAQSRDCEARIGPASAIRAIRARCFLSQHCGLVSAWMGNLGASDSPGTAMLACFSARQSPKPAQSIGIFFRIFVEVAWVGTLLAHLPALDVVFVSFPSFQVLPVRWVLPFVPPRSFPSTYGRGNQNQPRVFLAVPSLPQLANQKEQPAAMRNETEGRSQ